MDTDGFVDVEGTRLYYEVTGSGPQVVLLHGGWLNLRQWDDQIAALSSTFTVIRYDARGYGRSPLGTAPYSHHADLAAVLRALNVERPHLVALSNGASIAVDFAISFGDSVRSLAIGCAPMRGHDLGPQFWEGMRAVIRAGVAGRKDECRAALWGFAPLQVAATIPAAAERIDKMVVEDHEFGYARPDAPSQELLEPPTSSRFAEVTAPTLVIVGDGEMPALAKQGALMAQSIPNARLTVINGAGHIVNMEQPEAYTRIVLEWLETH